MRSAAITAFVLSSIGAATGCSVTAQSVPPTVVGRECSAPGAYVVSPPTIQHGFDPSLADPRVITVGAARLEGRSVLPDTSRGVPARTAADASLGRGGTICF
jgi:hypothetical protein